MHGVFSWVMQSLFHAITVSSNFKKKIFKIIFIYFLSFSHGNIKNNFKKYIILIYLLTK